MVAERVEPEGDLLSRLQVSRPEYAIQGIDGLDGVGTNDTGSQEDVHQRIALLNRNDLDDRGNGRLSRGGVGRGRSSGRGWFALDAASSGRGCGERLGCGS